MKEIRPEHVERAFRRLHDFSVVQRDDMDHWSGAEMPEAILNLCQSLGLTPDAVEEFLRQWRDGFGDENVPAAMIALNLGLLTRIEAEENH